jgi:hypothetical protein
MDYTEREVADFRGKFSKLQRRRRLTQWMGFAAWVMVAAAISAGKSASGIPAVAVMVVAIPAFFAAAIGYMFFWKCPACRARLAQDPKLKFCYMCGLSLSD